MTTKTAAERKSQDRAGYIRALALKWLDLHRPDVLKTIQEEGVKRYPRILMTVKVELPDSLRQLR